MLEAPIFRAPLSRLPLPADLSRSWLARTAAAGGCFLRRARTLVLAIALGACASRLAGEEQPTLDVQAAAPTRIAGVSGPAAKHVARAIALEAAGDFAAAEAELRLALDITDDVAIATRIRILREARAAPLRSAGEAYSKAGRWDDAVRSLAEAEAISPTVAGAARLAEARSDAAAYHEREFRRLVAEGDQRLAAEVWAEAARSYSGALDHQDDESARRRRDFAVAMHDAESLAAGGEFPSARAAFQRALTLTSDTQVVRRRMRHFIPQRYRITLDAAAIVPRKPDGRLWDVGVPSGVVGFADVVLRLVRTPTPAGAMVATLGQVALELVGNSIEPPDCYPVLTVGALRNGGADWARGDSFTPAWGLWIETVTRGADDTVVRVAVWDEDLIDDDLVGVWTSTLGNIVERGSIVEYRLLDPTGRGSVGGIAALQFTVTRVGDSGQSDGRGAPRGAQ